MPIDQKISQLASGNPAQSGDILPIDRAGSNFGVTAGSIAALASLPTGSANQVVATPNGSSGTAALRSLVAADVPSLPASQIGSGQIALARGGTNADLSATGGASQFLKQASVGAAVTVAQPTDADLSLSDITTNNVSTAKHGFAPKSPNDATKYLDGTGNYTVPAGGGGGSTSFAQATGRVSNQACNGVSALTTAPQVGDVLTIVGSGFNSVEAPTSAHGYQTSYKNSSPASNSGIAGLSTWRTGKHIQFVAGVQMPTNTDCMYWIGIFNGTPSSALVVSTTVPSSNYAAFRFSTITSGDTQIQACTRNGTTQTVTSTGVTPDTNEHRYGIWFDDDNSQIKFFIDGVLKATITTNLPTTGTAMNVAIQENWAVATANPDLAVSYVSCMQDW